MVGGCFCLKDLILGCVQKKAYFRMRQSREILWCDMRDSRKQPESFKVFERLSKALAGEGLSRLSISEMVQKRADAHNANDIH